jgi:hypothetical protein
MRLIARVGERIFGGNDTLVFLYKDRRWDISLQIMFGILAVNLYSSLDIWMPVKWTVISQLMIQVVHKCTWMKMVY